ncbi:hypothetical protein ADEAN_000148800 [Angomonas deanei]|uniref:Uncharacterized protein n=1 Tax=Angomonas deanei TaxID=59799 RepID=A0A7G2C4G9_9TRYP|nr:hypothetical protein ADEAN_000148800 [Angomonas deanei]
MEEIEEINSFHSSQDGSEAEEDLVVENLPLPPLPPVYPPKTVEDISAEDLYSVIEELRKQVDDPAQKEKAKQTFQGDTKYLLAVARVLQESNLLYRRVVHDGDVTEALVPQPEVPPPQLDSKYTSWIVQ